jgi:dolichol-phosphate mannosyltransferase
MAKVVIVIPTYNERKNTERMIKVLAEELPKIQNHDMHVLYADDTSPDGTYKVVRKNMKKYKWLHLYLNKEKVGLGKAYARAFKYAMDKLDADYIMEFDSDFQHRPDQIKDLVAKIDEGYEYIIGSRYIPGGSIPSHWGLKRKLLSVVGNYIARFGLLLPRVHDLTTGFKITKVKGVMDKIDLDHLYSNSFAYKIQILGQAIQGGAKWVEVPITFEARKEGESKIISTEQFESLKVIFLVQWNNPKIRKFLKFGTVGFAGYLVNASTLWLFTKWNFSSVAAWGLSTELAIINNFVFNNIWTFKAEKITGLTKWIYKFIQFNLTSGGALLIQVIFGSISDAVFGVQYRQLALPFIIVFLVLPYNYFMYNVVIWKSWDLGKLLGKKK